jgi:uncharacterized membrane protein YciS (DUF1049 family)
MENEYEPVVTRFKVFITLDKHQLRSLVQILFVGMYVYQVFIRCLIYVKVIIKILANVARDVYYPLNNVAINIFRNEAREENR